MDKPGPWGAQCSKVVRVWPKLQEAQVELSCHWGKTRGSRREDVCSRVHCCCGVRQEDFIMPLGAQDNRIRCQEDGCPQERNNVGKAVKVNSKGSYRIEATLNGVYESRER